MILCGILPLSLFDSAVHLSLSLVLPPAWLELLKRFPVSSAYSHHLEYVLHRITVWKTVAAVMRNIKVHLIAKLDCCVCFSKSNLNNDETSSTSNLIIFFPSLFRLGRRTWSPSSCAEMPNGGEKENMSGHETSMDHYEGTEKLLEVWFRQIQDGGSSGSGGSHSDLRLIPRWGGLASLW